MVKNNTYSNDNQNVLDEGQLEEAFRFCRGTALHKCGDYDLAEEIAQRASIRIWENQEYLDPSQNKFAWYATITVNILRDYYREERARPKVSYDEPIDDSGKTYRTLFEDKGMQSPLENAIRNDDAQQTIRIISHILDLETALKARGLSQKQISTALQEDLGTVKSRQSRQNKRLQDLKQYL